MSLYSYQCRKYQFVFGFLVNVGKDKLKLVCPSRGSSEIEKARRFFKINFGKGMSRNSTCSNCQKKVVQIAEGIRWRTQFF